ncbi:MAG: PKD domain-containing protein [bacterium]|nr:PKD domain-containing protein [bacterium]
MKRILTILSLVFFALNTFAQSAELHVTNGGIIARKNSTSTPHPSAIFEVQAGENGKQGILIPRMTAAERENIQEPAEGLLVYQYEDTEESPEGFYYHNGEEWLKVGSDCSALADMMVSILEGNGMILADFEADVQIVYTNTEFTFLDKSTLNSENWLWDFGDGNTSTDQNPTHTYTEEGTYSVSLTVSNSLLDQKVIKEITVNSIYGNVTDVDGNTYPTVKIGNQIWMAENLRASRYSNGTAIPQVTNNTSWVNLGDNNTDKAYCYYNNNANYASAYGALYSWAAASNGVSGSGNPSGIQGVCPTGWHLPSDAEWTELTDYLGGESLAGDKMKEAGTTHWTSPNNGTNSSGFTAVSSPIRRTKGTFSDGGDHVYWWSATDNNGTTNNHSRMLNNSLGFGNYAHWKSYGFSVRCLKN